MVKIILKFTLSTLRQPYGTPPPSFSCSSIKSTPTPCALDVCRFLAILGLTQQPPGEGMAYRCVVADRKIK